MSAIVLVEQSPLLTPTPTVGKVRIGVDLSGNLFSKDDAGNVILYSAGLTTEQVEDIVGGMLQSTSTVQATYDDSGNAIYFDVLAGGVDHDALLNFIANEHIDHSTVAINAGTGLTGGGDLTATRTISMPNVGTAGSYGSSSTVPVVTTDAQGRVTGVAIATITPVAIGAQPVDVDLTALAALTGTGIIVRSGSGTAIVRSIAAGPGLTVTNADGVSDNPTVAMPNVGTAGTYGSATAVPVITTDAQGRVTGVAIATITPVGIGAQPVDADLTALAALTGSGLIVRTGAGTAVTRSLAVGAGLTVNNGDGIAGDPTVAMPNVGAAGTFGSATSVPIITTDAQGRVSAVTVAAITPAGIGAQPLDSDLTAIAALTGVGVIVRTGAGTAITRNIAAGTGLTATNTDGSGGDPTISMPSVGTAGTYGSGTSVPVFTTDAQGRVTGVSPAAITPAGIGAQPLDSDLTAYAALVGTGLVVRTGLGTVATRSIASGSGLTVSNGDGISGDPTVSMPNVGTAGTYGSTSVVPVITTDAQGRVTGVSLATITPATIGAQPADSDLTAIAALTGTGLMVRTGTGTAVVRSIAAGAGLSISNADGVAGDPTLSMPNVGTPGTYGSATAVPVITTDAQGRVTGVSPATITPAGIGAQPVDADLTAIAALTGTGIITRTGAGTAIVRSVVAGAGLSVTDGDGVAGNPTVAMPNVGTAGTYGSPTTYPIITTDAQGRVTSVTTQLVSAVFGSEGEDFEDLTTATTTSTTFSDGASFVTATKSVGRFRIGFFFNYAINVNNADARFRITVNGVQQGPENRVESSETANQSNWESGFVYYDVPSAQTLTIAIQFAAETAGNTVSLFQSRVEIWRVS